MICFRPKFYGNSVVSEYSINGAIPRVINQALFANLHTRMIYHGDNDYGNDKIELKSGSLKLQLTKQMTTLVWQYICWPSAYQRPLPKD
jgi:hypothetical protein